MKAARRERSLAAASTDNNAAFNVTCTERDEASTERDEAFTETDAAFSVACTECGNPTEPSQRDRYLCRCLSCDRKSRERKQVLLFKFIGNHQSFFVGPLMTLFWIYDDICPGFKVGVDPLILMLHFLFGQHGSGVISIYTLVYKH